MAPAHTLTGILKQRPWLVTIFFASVLIWSLRSDQNPLTRHPAPQVFTGAAQNVDLSLPDAPFIVYPLARVCRETTFLTGLVFICDNNSGGPGNIRNYILTCLRYAIEAGATSLILPKIRSRSASDLSNIQLEHKAFSYMFNTAHFSQSIGAACPQIRLYDRLEDVPHVLEKVEREGLYDVQKMVERITPRQEFGSRTGCDQRDLNRHSDQFGERFRSWVNSSALERGLPDISKRNPRLIRLNWGVLWDWEVLRDGPEFVSTFGGLLRFSDELLDLGSAVVRAMQQELKTLGRESEDMKGSYLGIHLRTEEDALKQWPSFNMQASGYMAEAEKKGFRGGLAYLASGSKLEANKFAEYANQKLQLTVRTKHDLLSGAELTRLESLSWDQQAVVDFVVLLAAGYFVGVSPSSFSINVALKRHIATEGLYTRPWKVGTSGDGSSMLVGKYDEYWNDWLFMFDGMWP